MSNSVKPLLLSLVLSLPFLAGAAETEPSQGADLHSTSDTNLRRLVRDVGARVHKPFVVDPRAPQTLDLGSLRQADVTYRQLLAVLQLNGMVVVEDEGLLQVVPDANARQTPTRIVEPDDIKTPDDEWVTVIVPVRSVSAPQLVPILRPLMPQAGHMAAAVDRNALVIVDRSANARRIVAIVRTLEKLPWRVTESPPSKGAQGSE